MPSNAPTILRRNFFKNVTNLFTSSLTQAAVCFLLCHVALAQPAMQQTEFQKNNPPQNKPPTNTIAQSVYSDEDRAMQRFVRHMGRQIVTIGDVPGMAVVVVDNGKFVLADGFGTTRFGSKERVNENTVFRLASLSKSFAGTITALLVNDKAFRWDDRVKQYAPWFQLKDPNSASRLTIRQLLSHQTGLPYNTYDKRIEKDQPYETLARELSKVKMLCPTGDCYSYQNVAFSVIADVIYAATGDFYIHLVDKRLFQPLNMRTASFGKGGLMGSKSWARPHVWKNGGWQSVTPLPTYYRMPPAAGINGSANDMGKWMLAQLGHNSEVLSSALLQDIQKPIVYTEDQLRSRGWRTQVFTANYATGWRVFDYSGKKMIYHAGAVQGYRIMTALIPEKKFGVTVMWNANTYIPSGFMPMIVDKKLGFPTTDWVGLDKHVARKLAEAAKKKARAKRKKRRRRKK